MKSTSLIIPLLFFVFFSDLIGQNNICECDSCPINMPNNSSLDIDFYVNGIVNNDLSNSSQGLCSISLNFEHQFVGDLLISIESPSGQILDLVGPYGFFGMTDNSTYDISLVECSQTPSNNAGIDQWSNADMSAVSFNFTGSYWPVGQNANTSNTLNCLEDLNIGPVNGRWIIKITDISPIDFGILNSFELNFCDETGLTSCSLNPPIICDNVNLVLPVVQQDTNRAQINLESSANLHTSDVLFSAGDQIKLLPGFNTPASTNFKAVIENCEF